MLLSFSFGDYSDLALCRPRKSFPGVSADEI
jgi:hypothetical protein